MCILYRYICVCTCPKNDPKTLVVYGDLHPVTDDKDVLQSSVEGVSHGVLDVHHLLRQG